MTGEPRERRAVRRLILFVAGREPNSLLARENLRRLADAEPCCDFQVRVIDVLADHRAALEHGVLVTPCLVLLDPPPRVMVAGTLADPAKVQGALRLPEEVDSDD